MAKIFIHPDRLSCIKKSPFLTQTGLISALETLNPFFICDALWRYLSCTCNELLLRNTLMISPLQKDFNCTFLDGRALGIKPHAE